MAKSSKAQIANEVQRRYENQLATTRTAEELAAMYQASINPNMRPVLQMNIGTGWEDFSLITSRDEDVNAMLMTLRNPAKYRLGYTTRTTEELTAREG